MCINICELFFSSQTRFISLVSDDSWKCIIVLLLAVRAEYTPSGSSPVWLLCRFWTRRMMMKTLLWLSPMTARKRRNGRKEMTTMGRRRRRKWKSVWRCVWSVTQGSYTMVYFIYRPKYFSQSLNMWLFPGRGVRRSRWFWQWWWRWSYGRRRGGGGGHGRRGGGP